MTPICKERSLKGADERSPDCVKKAVEWSSDATRAILHIAQTEASAVETVPK